MFSPRGEQGEGEYSKLGAMCECLALEPRAVLHARLRSGRPEAETMNAYAAAMAADKARLEKARKRNVEAAALHGEDADDVEGAWDSVFEMGRTPAVNEAEEARRRKAQRKTEKRKKRSCMHASGCF